jgi:peptidoglycan/xylan/chitin deacetylase (PgdA/CDA1 family)
MKYVLIRDDDLNFFSQYQQVEQVYGFMFEREIPLNFSTIPSVNGAAKTLSPDGKKEIYEPFLPQSIAGTNINFSIADNKPLVSTLKDVPSNEFLLHGFEHHGQGGAREFETTDKVKLKEKLENGIDILASAFGYVPNTFVAPQDKYSPQALSMIQHYFKIFSLGWIDRTRIPKAWLPKYFYKKCLGKNYIKDQDFLVTEHPGCHYSQYVKRDVSDLMLDHALKTNHFTVIVTHHWEFYKHGVLDTSMWEAFKQRVLSIHQSPDYKLITFSQLRNNL